MEDECPYRVVTIPHPDVHNFFYIRKFPDVAYVYTDSPVRAILIGGDNGL